MITHADTLAYYKDSCRMRSIADASPVGLGAVQTQFQGDVRGVVAYALQSLSDVEKRYSQTEKEALALVWACELETDPKPQEHIYSAISKPSARIERWILRPQSHDLKLSTV